jgi:hypothetical protein
MSSERYHDRVPITHCNDTHQHSHIIFSPIRSTGGHKRVSFPDEFSIQWFIPTDCVINSGIGAKFSDRNAARNTESTSAIDIIVFLTRATVVVREWQERRIGTNEGKKYPVGRILGCFFRRVSAERF